MRNGLRKLSSKLNVGMDKIIPDAIVLAFILTFVAFAATMLVTGASVIDMIGYWGSGFWGLLSFSMQMLMIIATGHILASAPLANKFLVKLCGIPKTGVSGVVFIAISSAVLGWISWGLGLVAGAIIARTVAVNLRKVDFKLYVAVAYTGAISCGLFGISGSEFLLVNTPGYFMEDLLGMIPLSETVFEPSILLAQILGLCVVVPFLAAMIHTGPKDTPEMDAGLLKRFEEAANMGELSGAELKELRKGMSLAERLNNSPVTTTVIGVMGIAWLVWYFSQNGFDLTLDVMNFMLLMIGIILHGTPNNLLKAAEEGVKSAFGVAIQFPFYAGIQGMLGSSGMVEWIANAFASFSTPDTFHYINYTVMAIVNFFIPSSGGIFAVAGPSLAQAALELGIDPNKFVISFTSGETISNIIQPFWAIPLLGIANLKMKDIMGYCIIFFVALTIIWFGVWAILW